MRYENNFLLQSQHNYHGKTFECLVHNYLAVANLFFKYYIYTWKMYIYI